MIAKVGRRGTSAYGLLAYLYGPGTDTLHTDPHLVASWDGDPTRLEPPQREDRPGRYRVGGLARLLEAPLALTKRPPPKHIWHCSVRAAPEDPELSDVQWREVADEVMHETGIARRGDPDGCYWVAVRHAPNHIHLVAVLVDQNGKTNKAFDDYPLAGAACRTIEQRFGLRATPPPDRTATPKPSRAERRRHGPNPALHPRTLLRREAQIAAAASRTPQEYFQHLRDQQLGVYPRIAPDGNLTGYSLSWPGDHNADGQPIRYSGATLAPDLSLPKLTRRWASAHDLTPPAITGPAQRQAVLADGARTVRHVTAALAAGKAEGDGVAHATADVLAVTARITHGHQPSPLRDAADRYDRAARAPHTPVPPVDASGRMLRRLGRSLAALGRLDSDRERSAAAVLIAACAELVEAVAVYQTARDRAAQAAVARKTAEGLRAALGTLPPPPKAPARAKPTRRARRRPATSPQARPRPTRHLHPPTPQPRRRT